MKEVTLPLTGAEDVPVPSARRIARRLNQDVTPAYEVEEVKSALSSVDVADLVEEQLTAYQVWVGEEGDEVNGVPLRETNYWEDIEAAMERGVRWFYIGRHGRVERVEFRDPDTLREPRNEEEVARIGAKIVEDSATRNVTDRLAREARKRV